MKKEHSRIRDAADAALLVLMSRLSGPIICGLCGWILMSVSTLKEDMASTAASISGIVARVENLETWRNNMDAFAEEPHK